MLTLILADLPRLNMSISTPPKVDEVLRINLGWITRIYCHLSELNLNRIINVFDVDLKKVISISILVQRLLYI